MKYFKQLIIVLLLLSQSITVIIAQETKTEDRYYEKMKSSLYTLYKAGNYETFNMISLRLKKIAEEEETKWVPYYHASYAFIMTAFMAKEKYAIEELVNQAQNMIDKANEYSPNNDEITALQGFVYQARMINKTGKPGADWTKKAVKEYDHARFLNPENPRPYYLIGQMLYRLPPAYGGNKENACKHFIDAVEKYESFKPRSEFSPNWGKEANAIMLSKCKQ